MEVVEAESLEILVSGESQHASNSSRRGDCVSSCCGKREKEGDEKGGREGAGNNIIATDF